VGAKLTVSIAAPPYSINAISAPGLSVVTIFANDERLPRTSCVGYVIPMGDFVVSARSTTNSGSVASSAPVTSRVWLSSRTRNSDAFRSRIGIPF
jgi:hypothetical protein